MIILGCLNNNDNKEITKYIKVVPLIYFNYV